MFTFALVGNTWFKVVGAASGPGGGIWAENRDGIRSIIYPPFKMQDAVDWPLTDYEQRMERLETEGMEKAHRAAQERIALAKQAQERAGEIVQVGLTVADIRVIVNVLESSPYDENIGRIRSVMLAASRIR